MADLVINIVYVLIAVAVIVFLDFKYLRYDFQKRLTTNIIVVLVFVVFYYLFLVNL